MVSMTVGLAVTVRARGVTATGAGLTVMVKVVLAERLPESVAVMVTLETPETEGVPEMLRLLASKLNPLAGTMLAE